MNAGDAAHLLAESAGTSVELVRPLAGGEVGAFEVRLGTRGERGVLKFFESSPDRAAATGGVGIAERLREAGYPASPLRLSAESPDGLVLVFDWMDGEPVTRIDVGLVDHVLELNALQGGDGRGGDCSRAWGENVLHLLSEGLTPAEGYCLHRPLAESSPRSAELLRDIRRSAEGLSAADFVDGEVAHCDFHHRNLLVADDRISAVLDWDSARAGDAVFDLVTLAFCSAVIDRDPDAVAELWRQAGARRAPEIVRAYAALLALRQVDWSIRHRSATDVDLWLSTSEAALADQTS